MSKLKKRIAQVKKEYAEATPEDKREIVLTHVIAALFLLELILIPAYLLTSILTPSIIRAYIGISILVFGVISDICATISNHCKKSGESDSGKETSVEHHKNSKL